MSEYGLLPVTFVIDNSLYLENKFDELQNQLKLFDEKATQTSYEKFLKYQIIMMDKFKPVTIKTFDQKLDLANINISSIPRLNMMIDHAVESLENYYESTNQRKHKSLFFVLTSGNTYDNPKDSIEALKRVNKNNLIVYMPFFLEKINVSSDIEKLYQLKKFLEIQSDKLSNFFQYVWELSSLRASTPINEKISLNSVSVKEWVVA